MNESSIYYQLYITVNMRCSIFAYFHRVGGWVGGRNLIIKTISAELDCAELGKMPKRVDYSSTEVFNGEVLQWKNAHRWRYRKWNVKFQTKVMCITSKRKQIINKKRMFDRWTRGQTKGRTHGHIQCVSDAVTPPAALQLKMPKIKLMLSCLLNYPMKEW